MQARPVPSLFRRGPSAEVRLTALAALAALLLALDARGALEPLRQTLATALYPFQRAVMLPGDAVRTLYDWRHAAALIRSENESLQRQRIELAQLGTRATQLASENAQLRRLLDIVDANPAQPVVVVQVLYEPVGAHERRLVFNRGANHGIAPGMPVIDEGGVVGQIVRVTPVTAEAALITDGQIAVPVQVQRNGLRLIAFGGNAGGRIEVRYLDSEDVRDGDILVTSGLGGVFPAGLPVGRVERIERDPASGFAHAVGESLAHPERYRHFLVLRAPQPLLDTETAQARAAATDAAAATSTDAPINAPISAPKNTPISAPKNTPKNTPTDAPTNAPAAAPTSAATRAAPESAP